MKRIAWIVLGFAATAVAFAQNVVSDYSGSGTISVSTNSTRYIYTKGGSYRTGFFWYWRAVQEQVTQAQGTVPLPGTTDPLTTAGTYFPIRYSVGDLARTTFSNSDTLAVFTATLGARTLLDPTGMPDHAYASVDANLTDTFSFTIPNGADVTLIVKGGATAHYLIRDSTGIYYGYGYGPTSFTIPLDPGSYELDMIADAGAFENTQTGTTSNVGALSQLARYELRIAPQN